MFVKVKMVIIYPKTVHMINHLKGIIFESKSIQNKKRKTLKNILLLL